MRTAANFWLLFEGEGNLAAEAVTRKLGIHSPLACAAGMRDGGRQASGAGEDESVVAVPGATPDDRVSGAPAVTPDRPVRWTGAGLIPAHGFGYWSVGIPLVLLQLDRGGLTVRVRPALFGRLIGAKVLTANPGDGVEAFLVRNTAAFQGIEFRPPRRSSFYFFGRQRYAVLAALARAGFAVSSEPGRERPIWYQPDDD